MTTDSSITAQYLKLVGARFLIFCPSFLCHMALYLAVIRNRPSVPYGANFVLLNFFITYVVSVMYSIIFYFFTCRFLYCLLQILAKLIKCF